MTVPEMPTSEDVKSGENLPFSLPPPPPQKFNEPQIPAPQPQQN